MGAVISMAEKLRNPIILAGDPIDLEINKIELKTALKSLRKRHRIPQKLMAERTGLSVKCISDIESSTGGNPTLNSILKYLDCLGYDLKISRKIF